MELDRGRQPSLIAPSEITDTVIQVLVQRRLGVDLAARTLDTQAALMKALGGGWAPMSAPTAAPDASAAALATR